MKIIERETVTREYGFTGNVAIVDHPQRGRILIQDGFGGIDAISGGAVRFRHGLVIKLQNNDTLNSLKTNVWNDYMNLFEAVINGRDNSRPVLNLNGFEITNLARSSGLI